MTGLGTVWGCCAWSGGDGVDALVPSQPSLCQAGVALQGHSPAAAAAPPVLHLQHPGVAQSQLSTAPSGAALSRQCPPRQLSQNSCPGVLLSPSGNPQRCKGWVSSAVPLQGDPSWNPISPGPAQLSSLWGLGAPWVQGKESHVPLSQLCSTLLFHLPEFRISPSSGVKEKLP